MNYPRICLAAFGAFVAYFVTGGIAAAFPSLRNEFAKYPAVYRRRQETMQLMPGGMFAMFVAILAVAVVYASCHRGGSGVEAGARFGALIGVFSVCSFVVHNFVNLNIGLKLTVQQAAIYFVQWVTVGIAIGLIYGLPRV